LDSLLVLACALAAQGKSSEVRALLEGTPAMIRARLKREPFNASAWVNLGMVEAMLGNGEEAVRCARKGVEILPEALDAWTGPRLRAEQAFVYAWTGDKEKALAEYAHLLGTPVNSGLGFAFNVSANTVNVHTMRTHPFYFPLRGDPRFEALLNDPKNDAPLF
jgi:tetratricopeptide (TPR) repeat protein